MEFFVFFAAGIAAGLGLCIVRSRVMGFAAQTAHDYDSAKEHFDLRKHLNGNLICEGVIYGPNGRVSSRFTADFHGVWDGNHGTLTEQFHYDSGETQSRAWSIVIDDDGKITSTADDVIGKGEGYQAGTAAGLRYRLRLPEDAGGHLLDAIDWMYLLENGTIVNRSQFRKFGIRVAEIVATIRPVEATTQQESAA